MRFEVTRYWQLCDAVEVEANSPDEAIELAHEIPLDNLRADYVMGSLNSDPSADVESLASGGES